MAHDEIDWEPLKAGKLDEREVDELGLTKGRGQRTPGITLRGSIRRPPRQVAPLARVPVGNGGTAYKGVSAARHAAIAKGAAPFHFAHSFVSRQRGRTMPRAVLKGERVVVFPRKREVAALREIPGARYHGRHHCWTVPRASEFAQSPKGWRMRSIVAGVAHLRRRNGQGVARHANTMGVFQDYIERANLAEAERAEEVEHDAKGPISVGDLGPTREARQAFWARVPEIEKRVDSRLQCRIIAELPWWLTPEDRRWVAERFGEAFSERGLAWWSAVHKPDVDNGSDARNFHMHTVYHDRPVTGWAVGFEVTGPDGKTAAPDDGAARAAATGEAHDGALIAVAQTPIFADRKDREARGTDWVFGLKERFATIVNDAIERAALRDGRPAPYVFFAGSYDDLGIEAERQSHLGPKRTALERAGVATVAGVRNEFAADAPRRRQGDELQRRGIVAIEALNRLAMDREAAPAAAGDPFEPAMAAAMARADRFVDKWSDVVELWAEAEFARELPASDAAVAEIVEAGEGLPVPAEVEAAGELRMEARARTLDALLARASSPELAAEIERRRRQMLDEEGVSDVAEAARIRRAIEAERIRRLELFGAAVARFETAVETAAKIALARRLVQALMAWRAVQVPPGREAPTARLARVLPVSVAPAVPLMDFADGWHSVLTTPDDRAIRRMRVAESDSERVARHIRRRTEEAAVLSRLIGRSKAVADALASILDRFLPGGRSENALDALAAAFENAREKALSVLSQLERRVVPDVIHEKGARAAVAVPPPPTSDKTSRQTADLVFRVPQVGASAEKTEAVKKLIVTAGTLDDKTLIEAYRSTSEALTRASSGRRSAESIQNTNAFAQGLQILSTEAMARGVSLSPPAEGRAQSFNPRGGDRNR